MLKENRLNITLILIIIALFFFALKSTWPFVTDDAYITLRYAKHLAEGYGIVWNIGQAPLEGYSNFTYLLFGAIFYYFKFSTSQVIEIIRYFSLSCFILTAFMMYRTLRLWVSPTMSLLPIIPMISYPGFMFWTVSGLETPLFMLLIISTVYFLLIKRYFLAGLLMAIAGLTRPEAPLFFLIFGGVLLKILSEILSGHPQNKFQDTHKTFNQFKPLFYYILAFTALYLPYFLWRFWYFGQLFPNAVYCKFLNNEHPFSLVYDYFKLVMPLFILSIPAWLMPTSTAKKNLLQSSNTFLYYYILPGIACFFLLYGVDPVMAIFNRYGLPFAALLLIPTVLGCHQIVKMYFEIRHKEGYSKECHEMRHKRSAEKRYEKFTAILVLLLSGCLGLKPSFSEVHQVSIAYHQKSSMRAELSQWMKQRMKENPALPRSITIGDCGVIPVLLSSTAITDSLCLNSHEMTHAPINQSYPKFIDWVLNVDKPSYIILAQHQWDGEELAINRFEKLIVNDPRFEKNYHWIKDFSVHYLYTHTYNVYQRNNK